MDTSVVDKVMKEFPGRESQINSLYKFISEDDNVTTIDFLLHGPSNTGKTSVLKKLLELCGKTYILVDCQECYHPRYLFQTILTKLLKKEPEEKDCANIIGFMNAFEGVSTDENGIDFIIIKNCSSLGDYYVQAFMNFQSNFSIIFIDRRPEIYVSTLGSHVSKMYFPAYTKDEISKIIPLLRPQYDPEIFGNFLMFFLSCVYHIHRDIFNVLQLVDVFFPIYKKPIDDKELKATDLRGLYKKILPHLKMNPNDLIFSFPQSKYPCEEKFESMTLTVDTALPKVAKYLLIAAYIASFVSPANDRRLFSIKSSKKKKKIQIPNGNNTDNKVASLLGPKPFPASRLLNIYAALLRTRSCYTAPMLVQIGFLIEIKLLVLVGNDENKALESPRYKCIADFDFVANVAKSVDIELERYLVG